MRRDRPPLICVTGAIGAGKTTVIGPLAEMLGAAAFYEQVEQNPAYGAALARPERWAFEAELTFLLESLSQWTQARVAGRAALLERCAADNATVFGVSRLAHGEISAHEHRLLTRCADLAPALGGVPDLVVLLTCSAGVRSERVSARGVAGEEAYTEAYLEEIGERYEAWANTWTASPLIRFDSEHNDVRAPAVVADLAKAVTRQFRL